MNASSNNTALGRSRSLSPSIVLMNLWCYPALIVWTLIGILLFPLVYLAGRLLLRMPPERLARWAIWAYGRGWLVLMSPFVRFRREGMEHLSKDRPRLIAVNHFSFFDTYCMGLLPVYNIVFAVRSWPFRMFWYRGFMQLARYLDVEGSPWELILENCRRTFAEQGTVLFFPEGHRSRTGELQRFYSGAFKVAAAARVELVPLCIAGTDHLLPPGRKLFRPCVVTLRALEPIDTKDFQDEEGPIRLRKLTKERLAAALKDIRLRDSHGV